MENAQKVFRALTRFGAALSECMPNDFATLETVYQIGLPPVRIDILTSINEVTFEEAWTRRERHGFGETTAWFIGRDDLLRNKESTGRPRDLTDVDELKLVVFYPHALRKDSLPPPRYSLVNNL